MTYDPENATTLNTALQDLRDKVGGMTNWSVAYDEWTDYQNGKFVLQNPSGEYLEFIGGQNDELVQTRYGVDYNTTDGNWNDRFSQQWEWGPQANDDFRLEGSDSVTYWLSYADGLGFLFYLERNEGDQYDGDSFFGAAKLTELWDYDAAGNREGDYAIGAYGGAFNGSQTFNDTGEGGTANATIDATGAVNPDANFNDYVAQETNLVSSNQYQNDQDYEVHIGTHTLWLRDASPPETAHKETIDDGSGNDKYIILNAHSYQNDTDNARAIGMRVDI